MKANRQSMQIPVDGPYYVSCTACLVYMAACVLEQYCLYSAPQSYSFANAVCYGKYVRQSVCPSHPILCQNEATQRDAVFTVG